jgi:uncharacterized protein (TIGR02145 family)
MYFYKKIMGCSSVIIGNQEWMSKNLDVNCFQNGDLIPEIKDNEEWEFYGKSGYPAWCFNDNDPENGKHYGKLYNYHALIDKRGLCPKGWSIPTSNDFSLLVEYLGGKKKCLKKLKSMEGWRFVFSDNFIFLKKSLGGTNESGFNALPSGCRLQSGSFSDNKDEFNFWTSNWNNYNWSAISWLSVIDWHIRLMEKDLGYGLSVRCIKIK